MQNPNAIDNSIYEELGDRWYTANDNPVALLRAETKTKTPWVMEKLRSHFADLKQVAHLDVGCGAGFLSNALAMEGIKVTGLDMSPESLRVAKQYDPTKSAVYLQGDAYHLPFPDHSFDSVSAMDFLEHVEKPELVVAEVARVLKPNGLFFYHTFNRNWLAHLVVIRLVEVFVRNTPKHMHVINLFIKPSELAKMCESNKMQVQSVVGLKPRLRTLTIKSFLSGSVPEKFSFQLTKSLLISYMGYAIIRK